MVLCLGFAIWLCFICGFDVGDFGDGVGLI